MYKNPEQSSERSFFNVFNLIAALFLCLPLTPFASAQQIFSGAGNTQATGALNGFRAALGTDNGTAPPPQTSGRREINWDAVRLDGTDFNNVTTPIVAGKITGIPVNRFQARGMLFKEVFAVANDGFAGANAGVAGQFPAFSPANTFAPFNGNKLEVSFVLASAPNTTPVSGATRGFGVIFLDVEMANTTSIEYFNGTVSLGRFFVPVGASGQAEFLGVLFNAPIVTRAVITLGTSQIFNFTNNQVTAGLPDQTPIYDQVATDDFIYAEPVAATSAAVAFGGAGTAEATASLNAFRTAAGADNGTAPPPQTSGRREINWDAVRLDGTDFNNVTTPIVAGKITGIPINRFQARGALFGEVLAVANDGFVSANAAATNQFPAFSTANTFSSFNSNKYTVNFVLAGAPNTTPVPAATRGFGVIFLDVEQELTSSIEYFNGTVSLGKFFVPVSGSGQAEFLGVLFNAPVVTRVVVTAGTAQVFNFANGQVTAGPAENATTDLAVVDDFVYAEPVLTSTSVSAASYLGAALAPEAISVAFGAGLADNTVIADSTPLPTALGGTTLKIKDSAGVERSAPLFFVSPGQINYLVPAGTAAGDALITITDGSGRVAPSRARIESVAPGLFSANASGQGVAAAVALRVKANNELVYEPLFRFDAAQQRFVSVPVDVGPATETVYIILYGTGIRFRSALSGVKATLGGLDSTVTYAGGQTGLAGLDQINVFLPRDLAGKGEVDVILTVDGKPTNAVKVNVK